MQYSASLHYLVSHLHQEDRAFPAHSSRMKVLDLLDSNSSSGCFCRWCWWFICRFIGDCCSCRYFVCKTQPIHGWWFYCIWSNTIGPALAHIHPKLNVKTVADVGTSWSSSSCRACQCIIQWGWCPGGLGSPMGAEGQTVDRPEDCSPRGASPSPPDQGGLVLPYQGNLQICTGRLYLKNMQRICSICSENMRKNMQLICRTCISLCIGIFCIYILPTLLMFQRAKSDDQWKQQ